MENGKQAYANRKLVSLKYPIQSPRVNNVFVLLKINYVILAFCMVNTLAVVIRN